MFYVYVLRSRKDKSFYIGLAVDLKERMKRHDEGLVMSTKNIRPLELVYYEAYKSKKDALIRERRLKYFAKGFSSLRIRLKDSLII